MRVLLPLLALLTACVDDLPTRQVQQPPPDRGIPIPPPFRPDAFRGWGGGDGDAGELDAGDAGDLGRGPDATQPDHQVGDARPRDAGELDAGDGQVGDAGLVEAGAADAATISSWEPVDRVAAPACETNEDCVGAEVCGTNWRSGAENPYCQLPCTPIPGEPRGQSSCPGGFVCCVELNPQGERTFDPHCVPHTDYLGRPAILFRTVCDPRF